MTSPSWTEASGSAGAGFGGSSPRARTWPSHWPVGSSFPLTGSAVISPGIPPGPALERSPSPKIPVVGTAGLASESSGFGCFLEAAQLVLNSGRDAEFLIARQGEGAIDLRRLRPVAPDCRPCQRRRLRGPGLSHLDGARPLLPAIPGPQHRTHACAGSGRGDSQHRLPG